MAGGTQRRGPWVLGASFRAPSAGAGSSCRTGTEWCPALHSGPPENRWGQHLSPGCLGTDCVPPVGAVGGADSEALC